MTNQRQQMAPPQPSIPDSVIRLPSNIDPKMPLPWVLSLIGGLVLTLGTIWFQNGRLQEEVRDLKIEVKTWNATAGTFSSDINMLKFRMDTIEANMRSEDRRTAK